MLKQTFSRQYTSLNGYIFLGLYSGLMRGMFEKIENLRIFKHVNPESNKVHKYTVVGFMLLFKPNNHLVVVVANDTELMETFCIRYVNWTLNHE
uniref:Uncharacterized protein n=1 Tax=Lactuca sativa TaxID=4236 RepID=A0A9R1UX07_LACSA|nr:hypothetical protein LSAT_V11C800389800 [Lactuca sativa]